MSRKIRGLSISALLLLFLIEVYRAASQSVVCDEAYSWQLYLSHPITAVFTNFTAANHLYATLLSWISFHALPWPVFAMRLPTVLAAGWYFVNIYRLCSRLFSKPLHFVMGLGLLSLNPLVLDCLVVARGYGFALAGMSYALVAMVDYLSFGGKQRHIVKASLGLSFAIGTSLTFLTPSAALVAIFAVLSGGSMPRRGWWRRFLTANSYLVGPLLLNAAVLYFAFPLREARREHFYWGAVTAWESLRSLLHASFAHSLYIGSPDAPGGISAAWLGFVTLATPAVMLVLAARIPARLKELRDGKVPSPGGAAFLLGAGTVFLSVIMLWAAHAALAVRYPVDRLGVFFLLLMPVAILTAVSGESQGTGARMREYALTAFAAVAVASFLWQFQTKFFYVWRYDADTEQILSILNEKERASPRLVRLGISWPLEPAVNFCRAVKGYRWLAPADRSGPKGDFDYYILVPPMRDIGVDDEAVLKNRRLTVQYRGRVSGTRLAVPAPSTH
ncbi:MAG TPA: hypothetical protein VHD76_08330 [Bryobacteraceae bacterium]|jgi:hypothetical protein|nr:hypothetical protein [Bryobacteraceae bacterium]